MKEVTDKQFRIAIIGFSILLLLFLGSKLYEKYGQNNATSAMDLIKSDTPVDEIGIKLKQQVMSIAALTAELQAQNIVKGLLREDVELLDKSISTVPISVLKTGVKRCEKNMDLYIRSAHQDPISSTNFKDKYLDCYKAYIDSQPVSTKMSNLITSGSIDLSMEAKQPEVRKMISDANRDGVITYAESKAISAKVLELKIKNIDKKLEQKKYTI